MSDRRLPPLNLLRVFDAAGRHLSFKAAAEELHVTPSAVSHQIKTLEEHLGLLLFHRLNRALELTDAGHAYLRTVSQAMEALRNGTAEALRRYGRPQLKITMGPFIASEVVVPALRTFQREHPEVNLRIDTGLRSEEFRNSDMDIAIRYGSGDWPDVTAVRLFDTTAAPVCAPRLAKGVSAIPIEEITRLTLIQSSQAQDSWQRWGDLAGINLTTVPKELWLDDYMQILRAAEQGLGLALGLFPWIMPWVKAGRLAKPWKIDIPVAESYYLIHRPEDGERPEILAFIKWLQRILKRLEPAS